MKFRPAAAVRTSTCPGAGEGTSVSVHCRTSGPPVADTTTAWWVRGTAGVFAVVMAPL